MNAMKFEFMRNDSAQGLENYLVVVQILIYQNDDLKHTFKLNVVNKSIEDFDFSNFEFDKATVTVKSGGAVFLEKTLFGYENSQTFQVGLKEKPLMRPKETPKFSLEPVNDNEKENKLDPSQIINEDHSTQIAIGMAPLIFTVPLFLVCLTANNGGMGALIMLELIAISGLVIYDALRKQGHYQKRCPKCNSNKIQTHKFKETLENVRTVYRREVDSVTRNEVERPCTVTDIWVEHKIKCQLFQKILDESRYTTKG